MNEVEDAALGWFVRLRGSPGAAERRAFERWLADDPSHRHAFAAVERDWRLSGAGAERVLAAEQAAIAPLLASMDAPDRGRVRFRPFSPTWRQAGRFAAACLCLLLVAAGLWLEAPALVQDLAADAVSGRGERRQLDLADGSTVLLDADSAVALDFGDSRRQVRLLRGRAFFSVVRGAAPFEVASAGGVTQVLGTRFEVHAEAGGATVTVAEGQVRVAAPGGGAAVLTPGQQVRYGDAGLGAVAPVSLGDAFAWQQGRHVFYHTPLSEVVEVLQRYRPGRIVIVDDALAARKVSGSFAADQTGQALDSLAAVVGFRQIALGGHLTLLLR